MIDQNYLLKHLAFKVSGIAGFLWYFYENQPKTPFQWCIFGGIVICFGISLYMTWDGKDKVAPGKEE